MKMFCMTLLVFFWVLAPAVEVAFLPKIEGKFLLRTSVKLASWIYLVAMTFISVNIVHYLFPGMIPTE